MKTNVSYQTADKIVEIYGILQYLKRTGGYALVQEVINSWSNQQNDPEVWSYDSVMNEKDTLDIDIKGDTI